MIRIMIMEMKRVVAMIVEEMRVEIKMMKMIKMKMMKMKIVRMLREMKSMM